MSEKPNVYLGDGVYATFDGWMIAVKCNCMSEPNTIFLEPQVMERLIEFYKSIYAREDKNEHTS